ncbi:hypothetical protein ACKGJO_06515 [Gracilimonas sp. Q87]|uniref:hypothetical protein n=1 Tax=Gracilimonas sp. Q87 TaxID=3384766 RepID=UPI003984331B
MNDQQKSSGTQGTVVHNDVEKKDPTPTQERYTAEDKQIGEYIKQFVPEATGLDPTYVMDQMRTNGNFFDSVTSSMVNNKMAEMPDTTEVDKGKLFNTTKAELRGLVTRTTYSGEDVATTISSSLRTKRTDNNEPLINNPQTTIFSNKDKYEEYVDGNNLSIDDVALRDQIGADSTLYGSLMKDKIEEFDRELNKSHNVGFLDPTAKQQNPQEYSKAFLMYEKYNKEGLTQYLNYATMYDPDKPYEEQTSTARTAFDYLTKENKEGIAPYDYVDSTAKDIEFKPFVPKKANEYNHNAFSRRWYDEKHPEFASKETKDRPFESVDSKAMMGLFEMTFGQTPDTEDLADVKPEELEGGGIGFKSVKAYEAMAKKLETTPEEFVNGISNSSDNAFRDSENYKMMTLYLSKFVEDGEAGFGVDDLFKTVAGYSFKNGGARKIGEGQMEYRVKMDEAPLMVQTALDILDQRSSLKTVIRKEGAEVILEPNRMGRVQDEEKRRFFNNSYVNKVERTYDDNGNVVREVILEDDVQKVPSDEPLSQRNGNVEVAYELDQSGLQWGQNVLSTFTHATSQMVAQFAGEKLYAMLGEGADLYEKTANLFKNGEAETSKELRKDFDVMYQQFRDMKDGNLWSFTDSWTQKGVSIATPMLWFIGGLKMGGRTANKQIGKGLTKAIQNRKATQAMKALSDLRQSKNLSTSAKFLKLPKDKTGAMLYKNSGSKMQKLATGLRNGNNPLSNVLDFTTGTALFEITSTFADEEYQDSESLFGSGFVDVATDYAGYETDTEGWYKSHGNSLGGKLTKIGISVLADEALGVLFDSALGVARANINMGKLIKNGEFKSMDYGVTGVKKTDDPFKVYQSDTIAFFKYLNSGMTDEPVKNLKEGLKESAKGVSRTTDAWSHSPEYLANTFTKNLGPVVKDLRTRIKETLVDYDKTLSKGDQDMKAIDEMADKMYDDFWEEVSGKMSQVMDEETYNGFISELKKVDGIEYKLHQTEAGSKYMTKGEAVEMAHTIPNAKVESVGDGKFKVVEPKGKDWMNDLIGGLNRKTSQKFTEEAREEAFEAFTKSNRPSEIDNELGNQFFFDKFGKPYHSPKGSGIVKGIEGDEIIVETPSGNTFREKYDVGEITGKAEEEANGPLSKNIDKVKLDERLTEGKVAFKTKIDPDGEVDLQDPKQVKGAIKKVSERIENKTRTIEKSDPEQAQRLEVEIKRLNNVLEFLRSRKKFASVKGDARGRVKTTDDVKQETKTASEYLEGNERYKDPSDLSRTTNELENRAKELQTTIHKSTGKEAEQATEELEKVATALNHIERKTNHSKKLLEEVEELSDTKKSWFKDENGEMINMDDVSALSSRATLLSDIIDTPSMASGISKYNEGAIKSARDFLVDRIAKLSSDIDETDPKAEQKVFKKLQEVREEVEANQTKIEFEEKLSDEVETLNKRLKDGKKKSYKASVNRAKKKDEALKETGIQATFLRAIGEVAETVEQAKTIAFNLGGSLATDFTKLTKSRAVREFDSSKGGSTGNVYYVQNADGTVDHFLVNKKPTHPNGGLDETVPSTRLIKIDGVYKMNPFYRYISPNELATQNGTLQRVSMVEVDNPITGASGFVVKPDPSGEFFANIQRSMDAMTPTKKNAVTSRNVDEMVNDNIDSIRFTHKGEKVYATIGEDQVMDATNALNTNLKDVSKIERIGESPSYRAGGSNGKKMTDKEKILTDLEGMGIPERILSQIRSLDFEEPVTTNSKPASKMSEAKRMDPNDVETGDTISMGMGDVFNNYKVQKVLTGGKEAMVKLIGPAGRAVGKATLVDMDKTGIYKPFAMTTAGLGIMALSEKSGAFEYDEREMEGAGLSGMVMALIGAGLARKGWMRYAPKSYKLVSTGVKGFAKKAKTKLDDPRLQNTLKADGKELEDKGRALGVTISSKDPLFKRAVDSIEKAVLMAKNSGKAIDMIMSSSWTQSTLTTAKRSGSPTAKRLVKVLEGMPTARHQMMTRFKDSFEKEFGTNSFNEFFNEEFKRFSDIIKLESSGKELEAQQLEAFNAGIFRLMNSKLGRDSDGVMRQLEMTPSVKKVYENDETGIARELDNALLEDERAMKMIESMRKPLKKIIRKRNGLLLDAERKAIQSARLDKTDLKVDDYQFTEGQYATMLTDFYLHFEGSWSQYIKAHSDKTVKKLLRRARKKDASVKRLNTIRNMRIKSTSGLEDMYFPQIFAGKKNNKMFAELGKEEYEKQLKDSIFELNGGNDAVKVFDEETGKLTDQMFDSEESAVARIKQMLELDGDGVPNDLRQRFFQRLGELTEIEADTNPNATLLARLKQADMIEERIVDVKGKDGSTQSAKRYVIKNLDDISMEYKTPEGDVRSFNIVEYANSKHIEDFYDYVSTSGLSKNSNFLDRPRQFHIDHKFIETDIRSTLDRYARDTNFRIRMMQEGVFDSKSLQSEFFKPMKAEMTKITGDSQHASTIVDRMRTAYNAVGNIVPEMATATDKKAFIANRMMAQQLSEAYRSMLYGMYSMNISLLDTVQPLISTAIHTSYKSTGKMYGNSLSTSQLNNLIDMSKRHHIISGIDDTFADFDDKQKFAGVLGGRKLRHKSASTLASGSKTWQETFTDKVDFRKIIPKAIRVNGSPVQDNIVPRLALGNLRSKNETNLTLNWVAFAHEAIDMAKKSKQMADGTDVGLSKNDVETKMELLGIPSNKIEKFIEGVEELEVGMKDMRDGKMPELNAEMEDIFEKIVHTATETYHGKNKVWRPEGFHSTAGKTLTTFWNFSFNQALQIVKRRGLNPLNEWITKHGAKNADTGPMSKLKLINVMTMSRLRGDKRIGYLKKKGFSQEAIDDMPYLALDTLGKSLMATGINSVYKWSVRTAMAYLAFNTNEIMGWDNRKAKDELRKEGYGSGEFKVGDVAINRFAKPEEQYHLGYITDPNAKKDLAHLTAYTWALGMRTATEAMDIGLGGPVSSGVIRFGDVTPAGLSMGQRLIENTINTAKGVGSGNYTSEENLPSFMYNTARTFLPPLRLLPEAPMNEVDQNGRY